MMILHLNGNNPFRKHVPNKASEYTDEGRKIFVIEPFIILIITHLLIETNVICLEKRKGKQEFILKQAGQLSCQ
jgi:hypothetical protein